MAEEQADVAAETAGRVVSTPVERGTRGRRRAPSSIRLSPTETDAQLKEAEANAAQIEARLGLTPESRLRRQRGARSAEREGGATSWRRASSRASSRCSISASSRSRSSTSAARRWKRRASSSRRRRTARRSSTSRCRRRAPASRSRARRSPTRSSARRSPALVAERLVSVGDYVTKGMKVAVVVRVNPLRVQLTVPEQFVSAVAVGPAGRPSRSTRTPGRQFEGKVRYVSPSLEADQRALTVEALVPNPSGELKPGLFATARIQQPARRRACSCRPPPCAPAPARAACSSSTAITWKNASSRPARRSATLVEITNGLEGRRARGDEERRAARRRHQSGNAIGVQGASCNGLPRSASNVRSSRPCSSCR